MTKNHMNGHTVPVQKLYEKKVTPNLKVHQCRPWSGDPKTVFLEMITARTFMQRPKKAAKKGQKGSKRPPMKKFASKVLLNR